MKKFLLIGVYGMEVVECGGALLKNVDLNITFYLEMTRHILT